MGRTELLADSAMVVDADPSRGSLLRRGYVLEDVTLGWNVAGIGVPAFAAITARSVALAGSGWIQ
jgi:hypothetical protein